MVDDNHRIIAWIGFPSQYTAGQMFHLTSRAPPNTPLTLGRRCHDDAMDPLSLPSPGTLFQLKERWELGWQWGHLGTNTDGGRHSITRRKYGTIGVPSFVRPCAVHLGELQDYVMFLLKYLIKACVVCATCSQRRQPWTAPLMSNG
jgi:hypothetical protein